MWFPPQTVRIIATLLFPLFASGEDGGSNVNSPETPDRDAIDAPNASGDDGNADGNTSHVSVSSISLIDGSVSIPIDVDNSTTSEVGIIDNPVLQVLPSNIHTKPRKMSAPVWEFFRELTRLQPKVVRTVSAAAASFGVKHPPPQKRCFKPEYFTHVCLLCLEEVQNLENATEESWRRALCNISKTYNGEQHLRSKHKTSDKVVTFLDKKKISILDGREDMITTSVYKLKSEEIRHRQARWLALNNLPHHITKSPEFKEMFLLYDEKFKPIAKQSFDRELEHMFEKMIVNIKALVKECQVDFGGMRWLCFCQDLWSTMLMDGALGSSFKITTRDMQSYTIAALLVKNNLSHGSVHVADLMAEEFQKRYEIDLKTKGFDGGSDTANLAHAVSSIIRAEQDDC